MTIDQVIRELEKKKRELRRELVRAEVGTIREAKGNVMMLSSGKGAPKGVYSRRRPNPSYDPGIINVQTGQFRDGWFTSEANGDGSGKISNALINMSPHADFMKGTRLMITRPILKKVIDRMEPARERRIQTAIDKVCR